MNTLKYSNCIEKEVKIGNFIIKHILNEKENYFSFNIKYNESFRILNGTIEVKE